MSALDYRTLIACGSRVVKTIMKGNTTMSTYIQNPWDWVVEWTKSLVRGFILLLALLIGMVTGAFNSELVLGFVNTAVLSVEQSLPTKVSVGISEPPPSIQLLTWDLDLSSSDRNTPLII